ncbi:hypothetical protein L226DRAFT_563784 [Lentinus tigrinus ALCF2SS1-7]|uniref:FHA domain-containing protein n=1 Tax=Lentinus tigrinus ALCF2SS1-6 TaxID=1328759 RepID=A0A5C2RM58_9APHY|nr:hypothetical protein L227DRAFT_582002 [Lentinus tigrinus ALCF2SS1-6]RPD68729.1 hypothetical protein L226DRAFT_563784 [Lentinus tigrinus ALCF2SS1-7]
MDGAGIERSNISGIVLHVEENDEQPSEVLSYRKNESRIISVGRKPCQPATHFDPERALFRCPVVSRKHAKITFTEYGNVYITDLHSHHGTHILRPGDLVSTALLPEVPTVLADGDRITFGKSVGRESYLVKPIVVRVELMFGGDAPMAPSPPPMSLRADAADEADLKDQGCDIECEKTPISGRYGVFLPSPESSQSNSDGESDIQEVSPPTSPRDSLPASFSIPRAGGPSSYSFGGRLQLLQHILPPIHHFSPESSPEPPYIPPSKQASMVDVHVVGGAVDEEDMDLSSSRESSPSEANSNDHDDIAVIGAWPAFPWRISESPSMSMQREVIVISDDDGGSPATNAPVQETFAGNQLRDEVDILGSAFGQEEFVTSVEEQPAPPQPEGVLVEVPQPAGVTTTIDLGIMEAQVADTYTELNVLRAGHDQSEAEFNAHVQETKDKLLALDAQMRSTQVSLDERSAELSLVQARLQEVGDVMKVLQEHRALSERVEELVREVSTAKELLKETCELQRETRAQMAGELEAVKALRAEASAAVAEAKAACASAQAQTVEVVSSLKRKRDAMEDEAPLMIDISRDLVAPAPKRRRAMRVVSVVARTATVATLGAVAAWGALAFS